MEIEVSIQAIGMVPKTGAGVVMLKEEAGDREIPIWVGPTEVRAIGLQIENYEPPRPFTHDLIREILRELDARVTKVVIHDVRENTFFAHIYIERKRERLVVDSRPSDAIALALRTRAPIYVQSRVIDARSTEDLAAEDVEPPEDGEALGDWLEALDEEDLGEAH